MKKKTIDFIWYCKNTFFKFLLLSLFLIYNSCENKIDQNLNIATAANMQFVMQELTKAFARDTGINCEIIVSSSGKLTAQIIEGAPYDIFVSANMKYPNKLYELGLTVDEPRIYAFGKLVIWTMNTQLDPDFKSFYKKHIKHIAMANPKTAPYGKAALEVLKNKGIYSKLENKFVFGESIAQTNQFIISYAAEIGFTAKSIVLSKNINGKGVWKEVDSSLYTPIAQGIVLIKNRKINLAKSKQFQDFLISEKGKEILNKFGYTVNDK
ncbi:MAG: molybdate ABC transporter substrate-binding protein [Flavobacteriaceae bacterium]|nr:molybdate ABC transporter substrate-binding protein [Flavobacteriaceae bacterium]